MRHAIGVALVASGLVACGDDGGGAGGAGAGTSSTGGGPAGSTASATTTVTASSTTSTGGGGGAGPLDPPACPPDSTELGVRDECADGPATPLDTVSGIVGLPPGEVVTMGGLTPQTMGCLRVRACVPDDAPTLLFSDEPEYVDQDGVLYADVLGAGPARLYVYHVNEGASPRRFTVVALNEGATDATITVERMGLTAPSTNYLEVGRLVAEDFLGGSPKAPVTVPAGERVVIDAALDGQTADTDELLHALLDVTLSAPLKVSVVSVPAAADAAAVTAGLPLLANTQTHVRGTFPGADRLLLVGSGAGVRAARLGADLAFDPDLEGASWVDDSAPATLLGNFGVTYTVVLPETLPEVSMGINPRGGAWVGALLAPAGGGNPAGVVDLPRVEPFVDENTTAVTLGRYEAGSAPSLTFLTGGSSSLPVELVLWPLP